MKVGTAINLHKALVAPVAVSRMWSFHNGSIAALIYLAILFVFIPLAGDYLAPDLLISRHLALPAPLTILVLSGWVCGYFVRNLLSKDKSLARYPQFAAFKQKSGRLFPIFF